MRKIFEIQWDDNVKARIIDESQSNKFVKTGKEVRHSQIDVYNWLKKANDKTSDK